MLWHGAQMTKLAEDIASTYFKFCVHHRNFEHIMLWMDNCSSQNKNWTLFSMMVKLVNSNHVAAEDITLQFLCTRHTFMSADSVHAQVERQLKKQKYTWDFQDYVDSCKNVKGSEVIAMKRKDFLDWPDLSSKWKLKNAMNYLDEMVVIKFTRGKHHMEFKRSHNDVDFETCDFLKIKDLKALQAGATIELPPCKPTTGIEAVKKKTIISNLVPLMPVHKRVFWENLPEADEE